MEGKPVTCTDSCRKPNSGGRQAHCSVCHRTFSGVSGFDDHRKGGRCVLPDDVTEKDGLWGRWGTTDGKVWWE